LYKSDVQILLLSWEHQSRGLLSDRCKTGAQGIMHKLMSKFRTKLSVTIATKCSIMLLQWSKWEYNSMCRSLTTATWHWSVLTRCDLDRLQSVINAAAHLTVGVQHCSLFTICGDACPLSCVNAEACLTGWPNA